MGHMGGLINPRSGRGQYRAGFSNTDGSPKPRKRAPCQKKSLRLLISCIGIEGLVKIAALGLLSFMAGIEL